MLAKGYKLELHGMRQVLRSRQHTILSSIVQLPRATHRPQADGFHRGCTSLNGSLNLPTWSPGTLINGNTDAAKCVPAHNTTGHRLCHTIATHRFCLARPGH
jgi:hypothetical protein